MASFLKNGWIRSSIFTVVKSNQHCRCISQYLPRNKNYLRSSVSYFHTSPCLNKIIPFYLSDIGEGIREVNVKEWFVKVGDKVEQFDNICEVQSDKASVTITSRYDGVITKLHHEIDGMALVGQPLIDIDIEEDDKQVESEKKDAEQSESSDDEKESKESIATKSKALATPAVRRIAMQNNLDLATVPATGRSGRILKEDILKFLNISSEDSNDISKLKKRETPAPFIPQISPRIPDEPLGQDKTVPISGIVKAMVKTMTASLKIPHFMYSDEIDITQLVAIRNLTKAAAEEAGVKLTFMPFFIKAASLALAKYPILNSSIDENCENITYKAAHNIGVAMDTRNGLIVPNIKNVQQKSIMQISAELNRLQQDGLKGAFRPEDLMGGTFSLSNIGIVGGTYTKPVIMSPQVSIGAFGKIQVLPRFDKNGDIVKAHIVCVSWSADHRIIDGVTMAGFSNKWKFYIENPSHLMLDL